MNATNEAIESMVLSNSQALKQNTEETTKLLENPAISMDKLRESFQNVFAQLKLLRNRQNVLSSQVRSLLLN